MEFPVSEVTDITVDRTNVPWGLVVNEILYYYRYHGYGLNLEISTNFPRDHPQRLLGNTRLDPIQIFIMFRKLGNRYEHGDSSQDFSECISDIVGLRDAGLVLPNVWYSEN